MRAARGLPAACLVHGNAVSVHSSHGDSAQTHRQRQVPFKGGCGSVDRQQARGNLRHGDGKSGHVPNFVSALESVKRFGDHLQAIECSPGREDCARLLACTKLCGVYRNKFVCGRPARGQTWEIALLGLAHLGEIG